MALLNEKIAASLKELHKAAGLAAVFKTNALTRTHLERLTTHGYLRPLLPGWVMVVDPGATHGSSTPYYANFWRFLASYCEDRFGSDWVVDAQSSLRLHADERTIPSQVIVLSPTGNNQMTKLPFETSLFSSRSNSLPPSEIIDGVRVMPLGEALVKAAPNFFSNEPTTAVAAIASLRSAAEVSEPLIRGGHSVIAGRLAAAVRAVGRTRVADEIVKAMTAAGHEVRESENPIQGLPKDLKFERRTSPVAARITAMWSEMREGVLSEFVQEVSDVSDKASFLHEIDERYTADAYHSLSIEGYQVTPDLIEKIRNGQWSPELTASDRNYRNALAAKGYLDCFKEVRAAVSDILDGGDAAGIVHDRHMDWFRAMFQPSVAAGIFQADRLAGYRRHFIYLDGSRYVPVAHASVDDAMDAFFECLNSEEDPRVRAILGHFIFTYIHPLPDGNGRLGRFIMNAMLASGGFPWTVIPVDDRQRYMTSLDSASLHHDIKPFANFVSELVRREPPPPRRRGTGEVPALREDETTPRFR